MPGKTVKVNRVQFGRIGAPTPRCNPPRLLFRTNFPGDESRGRRNVVGPVLFFVCQAFRVHQWDTHSIWTVGLRQLSKSSN